MWIPSESALKTLAMILAAFQSGLTPYLTHIAIVSAVGLFAVVLLVLFFVRRLFRIRTPIVYYLNEHDLTITFTQLDQDEPEVVVSLGAETRTFQLEGFINFWSDMVKVGRLAMDAGLELIGTADSAGKGRRPTFHRGEEKRPDKSAYLFGPQEGRCCPGFQHATTNLPIRGIYRLMAAHDRTGTKGCRQAFGVHGIVDATKFLNGGSRRLQACPFVLELMPNSGKPFNEGFIYQPT